MKYDENGLKEESGLKAEVEKAVIAEVAPGSQTCIFTYTLNENRHVYRKKQKLLIV